MFSLSKKSSISIVERNQDAKSGINIDKASKSPPLGSMEGIFFEIHGSKFKPDPFGNLSQATKERVTHTMLFFRIGETTLNCFFSFFIK